MADLIFQPNDEGKNPTPTPTPAPKISSRSTSLIETLHIAHLSSTPLIRKDRHGRRTPLEQLDVKLEKRLLLRSLREAGRQVRVRFETATSDNLRKMVTMGTRALHYSGHGLENELVFQDKYGQHHGLDVDKLRELITAGGGANCIQFAFVSACHSQSAGEAFAKAGVKHVVAVQRNKKISDNASVKFSEQFYLALLMGRTVRESFDIGLAALAAAPDQRTRNDANHMFILLPLDGNHDVPIFDDLKVIDNETNEKVVIDTTPKKPINRCDKPPALFCGRNVETQSVYELLMHTGNRCVTIHGPPGIGKTAVASRVCEYIQDQRSFDAVYMVRLSNNGKKGSSGGKGGGGKSNRNGDEGKHGAVENPEEEDTSDTYTSSSSKTKDKESKEIHYLHAFWESVGGRKQTNDSVNEDEFLTHLEQLSMRILLVLDGVQDVQMLTSLRRFVSTMLNTIDDVSLLCTTTGRDIIGGENLHGNVEKLIRLEGINAWDSARLLMARCPRKMRIRELGQGTLKKRKV